VVASQIWRQKTRVLGLPDGEEIMARVNRFFSFNKQPVYSRKKVNAHVFTLEVLTFLPTGLLPIFGSNFLKISRDFADL